MMRLGSRNIDCRQDGEALDPAWGRELLKGKIEAIIGEIDKLGL